MVYYYQSEQSAFYDAPEWQNRKTNMAKIGFIGLGHMGLPMAHNLVKAQHQVVGYDISPHAQEAFVQVGGSVSNSLRELAEQSEILITMLQTAAQVQHVCYDKEGLYAFAKPNTLHIDCSTVDILTAKDLHRNATKHALMSVDAPVSGGVAGAQAASLTFLLGGDTNACALAKPVLEAMGKQIIHTGVNGSGQAAKICNNMLLGITMLAVSECFILAEKLGLDAKKLHEVVMHASGKCWVMDRYVPIPHVLEDVPANKGYKPGFTINMMLKDLDFSQSAAQAFNLITPFGRLAAEMFQQAKTMGLGDLDFSAIIKVLQLEHQAFAASV